MQMKQPKNSMISHEQKNISSFSLLSKIKEKNLPIDMFQKNTLNLFQNDVKLKDGKNPIFYTEKLASQLLPVMVKKRFKHEFCVILFLF